MYKVSKEALEKAHTKFLQSIEIMNNELLTSVQAYDMDNQEDQETENTQVMNNLTATTYLVEKVIRAIHRAKRQANERRDKVQDELSKQTKGKGKGKTKTKTKTTKTAPKTSKEVKK